MRMLQGVRTGLGHGGITCVLQTQFSSFFFFHLHFKADIYIAANFHSVCVYITNMIPQCNFKKKENTCRTHLYMYFSLHFNSGLYCLYMR